MAERPPWHRVMEVFTRVSDMYYTFRLPAQASVPDGAILHHLRILLGQFKQTQRQEETMKPHPIRACAIRGKLFYARVTWRSRIVAPIALTLVTAIVAAACTGGNDIEEIATAQPTAAQSAATAPTAAPTAVPTTAAAEPAAIQTSANCDPSTTVDPAEIAKPASSELSIEEQKKALIAIVNERLSGFNNEELPRLKIPPDARDHRQGGIWVTIEFNSDFLDTIPKSKECLDILMRDTYEALFTAGFDLTWVDMTAIGETIVRAKGRSGIAPAQVIKTRLTRDVAETIDWANKESLDFDEIWNTLLVNPVWRRALKEAQEGD